jgi:hypothetical protein
MQQTCIHSCALLRVTYLTAASLQRAKSKMVLEHLVVAKAARADKLAQAELDDILRYGAKELFAEDEEEAAAAATATAAAEGADAAAAADGNGAPAGDGAQQDAAKAGEGGAAAAAAAASGKSALRIVWDDAALGRLLDRSQVEAAAAAAAGEEAAAAEEDEFTKAFKVSCSADLDVAGIGVRSELGVWPELARWLAPTQTCVIKYRCNWRHCCIAFPALLQCAPAA